MSSRCLPLADVVDDADDAVPPDDDEDDVVVVEDDDAPRLPPPLPPVPADDRVGVGAGGRREGEGGGTPSSVNDDVSPRPLPPPDVAAAVDVTTTTTGRGEPFAAVPPPPPDDDDDDRAGAAKKNVDHDSERAMFFDAAEAVMAEQGVGVVVEGSIAARLAEEVDGRIVATEEEEEKAAREPERTTTTEGALVVREATTVVEPSVFDDAVDDDAAAGEGATLKMEAGGGATLKMEAVIGDVGIDEDKSRRGMEVKDGPVDPSASASAGGDAAIKGEEGPAASPSVPEKKKKKKKRPRDDDKDKKKKKKKVKSKTKPSAKKKKKKKKRGKGKSATTKLELELPPATSGDWMERYHQLLHYKNEHDNVRVPRNWKACPALGEWVKYQRKLQKANKLSCTRVELLEKIGFDWAVSTREVWSQRLKELEDFKSAQGHCEVPKGWKDNPKLASWVKSQRALKKKGKMTAERVAALDDVGFAWSATGVRGTGPRRPSEKLRAAWMKRYEELSEYKARYGTTLVRKHHSKELARWVRKQRELRRRDRLVPERQEMLSSIDFTWDVTEFDRRAGAERTAADEAWAAEDFANWVKVLRTFRDTYGHGAVPRKWPKDPRLARWASKQRSLKRKNELPAERIEILTDLGFAFDPRDVPIETRLKDRSGYSERRASRFMKQYEDLKEFRRERGHCRVPDKWPENKPLARWVGQQRALAKRGKLLEARKELLDEIGFAWDVTGKSPESREEEQCRKSMSSSWLKRYGELVRFRREHGSCKVPNRWRGNPKLSNWVKNLRRIRKKGTLSERKVDLLDALGFVWDFKDIPVKRMSLERQEEQQRQRQEQQLLLQQQQERHQRELQQQQQLLGVGGDGASVVDGAFAIAGSVAPPLPPPPSAPTQEDVWDLRYEELVAYKIAQENCRVPDKWPENPPLARWVGRQRSLRRSGKLSETKEKLLNGIGFYWGVNFDAPSKRKKRKETTELGEAWTRNYYLLAEFKQTYGTCKVPRGWPNNPALAEWVKTQRKTHRNGTMTQVRSELLQNLGFEFEVTGRSPGWDVRYEQLVEFASTYGHCRVPGKWSSNPQLSSWIKNQRTAQKKGKLAPRRKELLDEIGFVWNASRVSSSSAAAAADSSSADAAMAAAPPVAVPTMVAAMAALPPPTTENVMLM